MKKQFPYIEREKPSLYEKYRNIFDEGFKVKTYLIYDKMSNRYKIGRSNNVEQRLRQLSDDNNRLMLFSFCNGNIECKLHKRFYLKKLNGEWFNLSDKDVMYIKERFNEQNKEIDFLKKQLKKLKEPSTIRL